MDEYEHLRESADDDTPRDPLALTPEEIAGIRKALRSPVGEDSAATGTIRRLLATLDATRPSGDALTSEEIALRSLRYLIENSQHIDRSRDRMLELLATLDTRPSDDSRS